MALGHTNWFSTKKSKKLKTRFERGLTTEIAAFYSEIDTFYSGAVG